MPDLSGIEVLCEECHMAAHGKRRRGISPEWARLIAELESAQDCA